MEALREFKAKIEETKRQMTEAAKLALPVEFKKLFAEWPEAEAIRWTQYTPYFNDGEPCVFGLHGVHVKIGEDGGDREDGYLEEWDFDKETEAAQREMMSTLEGTLEACKDVLLLLFGDHCQVTVLRDKTEAEVEEYDHD